MRCDAMSLIAGLASKVVSGAGGRFGFKPAFVVAPAAPAPTVEDLTEDKSAGSARGKQKAAGKATSKRSSSVTSQGISCVGGGPATRNGRIGSQGNPLIASTGFIFHAIENSWPSRAVTSCAESLISIVMLHG